VRHATSWSDLGIRCGVKPDVLNTISQRYKVSKLQQKVHNMKLNTDHFFGQKPPISDDDFKTIVKESDCAYQIMRKCGLESGAGNKKMLKRIEDLCIDISHFKTKKTQTEYKHYFTKVDAIDDETFKTLVNKNTTWRNLIHACGYGGAAGSDPKKKVIMRIEKLGLDRNHLDNDVIPTDKIFVVDSQYTSSTDIKKKLLRDFDWVYECAMCENKGFTKCDGVLLWNKKKIVLQLEHKNGIHNDNRLDNLELLCPNCHSQTSTFSSKNSKKRKRSQAWLEEGKTSHAPGSISSLLN
jgi:5-methylcytosine-specific restriction endonuclease McrA